MRNIRSGRKTHRFSTISSSRMRLYGRVCPFNGFPIADCTSSNSMHFCCTFMQSNLVLNHAADRPSENKLVFFFSSMSIAPSDIVPCRACDRSESKEYSIQRLLLGTHTSPGEPNHLMIVCQQKRQRSTHENTMINVEVRPFPILSWIHNLHFAIHQYAATFGNAKNCWAAVLFAHVQAPVSRFSIVSASF
jgi:hypothetical protein